MSAQIATDVEVVPQRISVVDITIRRMYRFVDIGESETWRMLEKTTRICTKWNSAIPKNNVRGGYYKLGPNLRAGVYEGSKRQKERREPNDKNTGDRDIGCWLTAHVLNDIVSVTLHKVIWKTHRSFSLALGGKVGRLTEGHEDYRNPPTETKVEQDNSSAAVAIQSDGPVSS